MLVTVGATEAIAAALLGLFDPGDEVVALEPYYDSYAACIAMAGATLRPVTLRPPDFRLDLDELRAAVTPRTRLILLNTPHNPTGTVLTRAELEAVAEVCREHDLIVVTDEVYEHLVFDGEHVPLATLPGMAERTLTISSRAARRSRFTGWKVGWATGPAELVARRARGQAVPDLHRRRRRSSPPVAHALALPDGYYDGAGRTSCRPSATCCAPACEAAGLEVFAPAGHLLRHHRRPPLG